MNYTAQVLQAQCEIREAITRLQIDKILWLCCFRSVIPLFSLPCFSLGTFLKLIYYVRHESQGGSQHSTKCPVFSSGLYNPPHTTRPFTSLIGWVVQVQLEWQYVGQSGDWGIAALWKHEGGNLGRDKGRVDVGVQVAGADEADRCQRNQAESVVSN